MEKRTAINSDYGFISFGEEKMDTLLEILEVEEKNGRLVFDGSPVRCEACGDVLSRNDLGTVASVEDGTVFYHDDPACFVHHVVNHLKD